MTDMIRQFLRLESAGGILLIIASALALVLANTSLEGIYDQFLAIPVVVQFGSLLINKPLLLWINDGLMAVFFLLVGLEVKREMLVGALNSKEKAVFPASAALGGMLAPALIYLLFNGDHEVARAGWAIPAATDIAFALGIMALLGKRVPISLKVFLLALAIIDDLGVIVIIALFYTSNLSLAALAIAIASTVLLIVMNRRGVAKISWYMVVGLVLWVSLLKSGVHATLAGVVLGFCIPLKAQGKRPLEHIEHSLHPWVA
ncbi:MAG: Na+/H+ antiporter NhaA, partial [Plesiomonas sp.]